MTSRTLHFFRPAAAPLPRRSRRGVTLVEAMISMVIAGMIGAVVVGILRQTGLATKDMYAETRTRSTRMIALDQIRYRLVEAEIGTVVISDSDHRIEFDDPNLGTTSAFIFVPATRVLLYDADVDTDETGEDPTHGGRQVASGPIDLTFESQEDGAIVVLRVKSAAEVAFGDVDEQDGETAVYLRNI